jgi:hypothetical protein
MFLLRRPLDVNPIAIRSRVGSGAPNCLEYGRHTMGRIVQPSFAGLVQLSLHG